MHINQLKRDTPSIINVSSLPTGQTTDDVGTYYLVNGRQLYRTLVPLANFSNPSHYEYIHDVPTEYSAEFYSVRVIGGTASTVSTGTVVSGITLATNDIIATTDGKLVRVETSTPSTILDVLRNGIVMTEAQDVYSFTTSPITYTSLVSSTSNYEYANQRYVDLAGSDSNSGKSEDLPKLTLSSALSGIGNNITININYGSYTGGVSISSGDNIDIVGIGLTGKNKTVISGLNTISGTANLIGFKSLNIASNTANTLITYSGSGYLHALENVGSNNNTATNLIVLGTGAYSTTTPNLITDFGRPVLRLFQCDFSTCTGKIVLPDLSAGQYASIVILDSIVPAIQIGTGWNVLYNADAIIGTKTYTGTASSSNLILTTSQSSSTSSSNPDVMFKVRVADNSTLDPNSSTPFGAGPFYNSVGGIYAGNLVLGDLILLFNSGSANNGIWVFNGLNTPMTRPTFCQTWVQIAGSRVGVVEGTYATSSFINTNLAIPAGTIGTTAINYQIDYEYIGSKPLTNINIAPSNTTVSSTTSLITLLGLLAGVVYNRTSLSKSVSYTLLKDSVILRVLSTGTTQTLPAANSVPRGFTITIKNMAGVASTTINSVAGTIDEASSITLSGAMASMVFMSDSANWWIVAKYL